MPDGVDLKMELCAPDLIEACILAGGLSSRMGRDKSHLRLGQRTLMGHIEKTAQLLGFKVRSIRRDSVERCGPMGGIATALESSRADCVLFLACDMPFVSEEFLRKMIKTLRRQDRAVFAAQNSRVGFPLLLRRDACLPIVLEQIERKDLSLRKLAKVLRARMLKPSRGQRENLANINTPEDLAAARKHRLK